MQTIKIDEINAKNPGESIRLNYPSRAFKMLLEDIRVNGILRPIRVYKPAKRNLYKIIDGLARYRAALELGLTQLPVEIVAKPGAR